VTELGLEKPRRGPRPRPLTSIQTVDDLPPYVREVVNAVAGGTETTREFAERQNVSIGAARERFRVAKNLGWIRVSNKSVLQSEGFRYVIAHRD
jgi:hypothetical protein